jgi:hypothetical protein
VKQNNECVPAGPEPIPPGVCRLDDPNQTFMGSSGYRKIPGNTCDRERGAKKDEKVQKSCDAGQYSMMTNLIYRELIDAV